MDSHERDFFIYQMLSGQMRLKTPDGIVIVKDPSDEIRYMAAEIYREALNNDLYEEKEILAILYHYGIWDDEKEEEYLDSPKKTDNLKVGIYKNPQDKKLRRSLRQEEEKIIELINIRHSWDLYTKQGYATFIKNQYILENTAFLNGRPYDKIHLLSSFLSKNTPTDKQIRELARTEPWVTLFEMGKRSDNDVGKRLYVYTKMYQNIREHTECPSEDIINDDDALDGWMILQKRKKEKERNLNEIDKKLGKNANKSQVFLPASNNTEGKAVFRDIKEVNKINDLNDESAKSKKKNLLKKMDRLGEVHE